MPQADRERAAIEVILDRKDRRESADRQGHPPHRCGGEKFPALLFRDQVAVLIHTQKPVMAALALIGAKVITPMGRKSAQCAGEPARVGHQFGNGPAVYGHEAHQ